MSALEDYQAIVAKVGDLLPSEDLPRAEAGDLACEEPQLLDQDRAWAALDLGAGTEGWVCHTGHVTRYPSARDAEWGPLLQAEVYDPESRVSVHLRLRGANYEVRVYRPTPGVGLRLTRSFRAIDGGRLRYETWWAVPTDSPQDFPVREPVLTRFVGFEELS